MKITIRTHYSTDDNEHLGDYISVEVLVDGGVVKTYDDYHDKGQVKAEAWVDGFQHARDYAQMGIDPHEHVEVTREAVSDIEI